MWHDITSKSNITNRHCVCMKIMKHAIQPHWSHCLNLLMHSQNLHMQPSCSCRKIQASDSWAHPFRTYGSEHNPAHIKMTSVSMQEIDSSSLAFLSLAVHPLRLPNQSWLHSFWKQLYSVNSVNIGTLEMNGNDSNKLTCHIMVRLPDVAWSQSHVSRIATVFRVKSCGASINIILTRSLCVRAGETGSLPLRQPWGFQYQAQGLHSPVPWSLDPKDSYGLRENPPLN